MKNIHIAYRLALQLALVLALAGTAFSQGADTPKAMNARDFWQAFQNDREKAEKAYTGETVSLSGVVVSTGISIYMTPNVMLSDQTGGTAYVVCVLPRADTGKLSGFRVGEQITMTGRVYRSKAGGGIIVKECRQAPASLTGGERRLRKYSKDIRCLRTHTS